MENILNCISNKKKTLIVYLNKDTIDGPFYEVSDSINYRFFLTYSYENLISEHKILIELSECQFNDDIEIHVNSAIFAESLGVIDIINQKWLNPNSYEKNKTFARNIEKKIGKPGETITLSISIDVYQKVRCLKLSNDLDTLLESGNFSDIVFVVGSKEFQCHQAILSARSEVFHKMFTIDMMEKINKRVEITDIEPFIFKELLDFIYTEKDPNLDYPKTEMLLYAAEKYDIEDLKEVCIKNMCKNLSIDNAFSILIKADLMDIPEAKLLAINFINANRKELANTEEFEELSKSHVHLLVDIFRG